MFTLIILINIFKFVRKIRIIISFFISKIIIYLDYWKQDKVENQGGTYGDDEDKQKFEKFIIKNPGDCTNRTGYGYSAGRPCVLVKMNKVK